MTRTPQSDGWENLRRRLEASSSRPWRGRWVPQRGARSERDRVVADQVEQDVVPHRAPVRAGTASRVDGAGVDAADVDAAGVEPAEVQAAGVEPGGADAFAVGGGSGADGADPTTHRRTWRVSAAHVAAVAGVVLVALVGTAVVVVAAQPSREQVSTAAASLDQAASGADRDAADQTASRGSRDDAGGGSGGSSDDGGDGGDTGAAEGTVGPARAPEGEPEPAWLVVHVAGEVASPGVVRLPVGSRVIDAVEEAGGALAGADLTSVNLARLIVDGEQVRVGIPPDPAVQQSASAGQEAESPPVIDLNAATAGDLESLPGVGPVLAGRIVEFREQNGPFRSVDQLIDVAGIGPAVLDDLDDLVRV